MTPASLTALAMSVTLPATTALSMSSITVRMSCWPRTFGSGTLAAIWSKACLPCTSVFQAVLSVSVSPAVLRTGM